MCVVVVVFGCVCLTVFCCCCCMLLFVVVVPHLILLCHVFVDVFCFLCLVFALLSFVGFDLCWSFV